MYGKGRKTKKTRVIDLLYTIDRIKGVNKRYMLIIRTSLLPLCFVPNMTKIFQLTCEEHFKKKMS